MGNSKVIFGNETLIDLTGDTVTPDTLLAGTTAHNRSGNQIVGTATVPDTLDDLTDVELTSPAEGDLLQYDATEQKWVNNATIPQKVAGLQKTGCVNTLDHDAISQVVGGYTFTVNSDRSITISGTDTENVYVYIKGISSSNYAHYGCPYVQRLVGIPPTQTMSPVRLNAFTKETASSPAINATDDGTSTPALVQPGEYIIIYIKIDAGTDLTTPIIIKPMLTPDLSATYADYQPYAMTNRELTEYTTKNWSFDYNYSTLTIDTTFTCPNDGYLLVEMPIQSTGSARLIYDGGNALFSETILPAADYSFHRVIFLRKGLKIKYMSDGATPSRVRFYSIV